MICRGVEANVEATSRVPHNRNQLIELVAKRNCKCIT